MVHPNDGLRPQINLPVLLLHSRKMKGYTLHHTTALPLHALTVSLPIQYNTRLNRFTILSFIWEIQWENSRVNPIPWVRKTVGQHTSEKNFSGALPLNPHFSRALPSIPRVSGALPTNPHVSGVFPPNPLFRGAARNLKEGGMSVQYTWVTNRTE